MRRRLQRDHPAIGLLDGLKSRYALADKGYDSRRFVELIQAQGIEPMIPPRTCQQPRYYDKTKYCSRNQIERCFSKFKQHRRIATRYD